ncbi:hypothetical protein [Serratia sp. UGAL515B_01]|uniref:hypothetical protein n=1 Tax=Serratia sp. UGAL515B_01 TaxID=2986763 RepID=UPI002953D166|nr:hypothetical protein [Serratia sp. UGAL515B_01]WON75927.1 hypothetical protein OK023_11685 [Serratia sp. UGAL515B_01]
MFKSSQLTDTYFIADLYREMTDQVDNVTFYIKCPHQVVIEQIKHYLRRFFDKADCQIAYEKNCASMAVNNILASKSGSVYRVIEETNYKQKVIFQSGSFTN